MTIAEKLATIEANVPRVFEAGKSTGYNEGYEAGAENASDPYEIANAIINGTITEFITYESGIVSLFNNGTSAYWAELTKFVTPNINGGVLSLRGSTKLKYVDIGNYNVVQRCFLGCPLEVLILRSETLVALVNTTVFTSSGVENGTCYVYVPRALLSDEDPNSDYRRATNWSTYYATNNNMFRALEDYTVDGTITGELDESKI